MMKFLLRDQFLYFLHLEPKVKSQKSQLNRLSFSTINWLLSQSVPSNELHQGYHLNEAWQSMSFVPIIYYRLVLLLSFDLHLTHVENVINFFTYFKIDGRTPQIQGL